TASCGFNSPVEVYEAIEQHMRPGYFCTNIKKYYMKYQYAKIVKL
ncbi:14349_t:CDS:2, partial [Dentiscutata heterogama]